MANRERIQQAIDVMRRVEERGDKFDITRWQASNDGYFAASEEELHKCGTAACFGGWLAVSPEFKAAGGHISGSCGDPLLEGRNGHHAVAAFLGIDSMLAADLCGLFMTRTSDFYSGFTFVHDITPAAVIDALETILEG